MINYQLDESGFIKAAGYNIKGFEAIDHPWNLEDKDLFDWRLIDGEWVNEKAGYKYFLIPSDLVPQIGHYAGFVKEALFRKSFNVKVNEIETIVEGQMVMSPLYINQIPCSCTHWTDEGLQLLEAVVENWNVSNPLKQIEIPYKFESYAELEAFIQAQI